MSLKTKEIWFIVGSQFLYGPKVLETVAARGQEMAQFIDAQKQIPCRFIYKGTVKTADEIEQLAKEANYSDACCGIVTWMHTFSPSKMWINGLNLLQKPYCHFATQYNREIPDQEIDMDFMNLNQAAHGDREHGFIATRMRLPRKVVAGFWQDKKVLDELGAWMRSAIGYHESKHLRLVRFGDNMREVAVTEGDKVEAQIKLGWQVNTWPVGELVDEMNAVTRSRISSACASCPALPAST
jgi:L-arabinose isomerase